MTAPGTLELVARELAQLFQPLEHQLAAENAEILLAELGLRPPAGLAAAPALVAALDQGIAPAAALAAQIEDLAGAIDGGDAGQIASRGAALLAGIAGAVDGLAGVAGAIDGLATSLAGLTAAQRDELHAFAAAFARRLIGRLLVELIERRYEPLYAVLLAAGAIEITDVTGGPAGSLAGTHQQKQLRFDRALRLIRDPAGLLRDVYRWGAPDFDGLALFRALQVVMERAAGFAPELLQPAGMPATLEAVAFSATVDPTGPTPGLDISVRPAVDATVAETLTQDDWTLDVAMTAKLAADVDLTLRPPLQVDVQLPTGTADLALAADVRRRPGAAPLVVFGRTGGSRLEVRELRAGASVAGHWDSGGAPVALAPALRAEIKGGKLVITGDGGDSLIAQVLRGVDLEAPFDLALAWSATAGLTVAGGAALAIDIPTHARLGPIDVETISLGLGLAGDALALDVAATIGARLGPLTAKVHKLGLRARLSLPPAGGNLGPVQLDLSFKPPTGVGLALETSNVTLAGLLDIDRTAPPFGGAAGQGTPTGVEAAHRYTGAVEIRIAQRFDLSAVGVITTRFPDGSDGFSLLFLINTIFPTPILLGYNFYLAGVGGLLGLHRTADVDRLRATLRDGAAEHLLFPRDVVANMAAIVGQLGALFPPKRDQFLVGPMARITWNSPPLIVADLGLILEFASPTRLAVVGRLRAAVPNPDEPIVDIKVAFLGTVDFDAGMLAFDASIYDSFIGRGAFRFGFEGDIALRLSWGAKKDFLASVGGFHPAYTAPAYLRVPKLRRVALSLLKDNPRLKLTTYFALTTNTVQFGAELDFFFKVSRFSVVGNFGFDVLFQTSPFRFQAAVQARLAVRAGSTDLLSLKLAFELHGTTPWRARGKASFGILFWTVSVHFDKTWGEHRDLTLPSVAVLPAALAEFRRDLHWKAALSARASQLVHLFPAAQAADSMVIDGAGVLEVSQCLVPLGARLELFNNARPSDLSAIDAVALRIAGRSVPSAQLHAVREEFAPAAFRALSDKDKLAASSYEPLKGGVAASGSDTLATDHVLGRPVSYERIVDDGTPAPPVTAPAPAALFDPLVRGGAVGASPLSRRAAIRRQRGSVRDVTAAEERFTVVTTANLRAVDAQSDRLSRSEAQARRARLVATGHSPDDLDIIPAYRAAR